mgnify:CR=1 FL=1
MVGGKCWAGFRILHPHPYSALYRRGGGSGPRSVFRIRIRIPYLHLGPSSVFRIRIRIPYSRELGPDPYSVSVSVFRICVLGQVPYSVSVSVCRTLVSCAQLRIPHPYTHADFPLCAQCELFAMFNWTEVVLLSIMPNTREAGVWR